jgi:hypothetical protein
VEKLYFDIQTGCRNFFINAFPMKGYDLKSHLTLENKLLAYQSVMGKGFSEGTFKNSTAFFTV